MICPNCGTANPEGASFCSVCQTSFITPPPVNLQMNQAVPTQPKTSGLAIASLVLGIASIPLCGLGIIMAIIGLILGCIAISKINRQPDQLTGKGLAIGGITTSIVGLVLGLLLLISILMPALGRTRVLARRVQCSAQLSNIGKAMALYSNEYNDQFPPTLELLTETMDVAPKNLVCPDSGDQEGQCSYIYRGNDLTAASQADMILAYDKYNNHKGENRNVLFVGYNVERINEEDFPQAIDHDNELRRQMGLPEKPLEETEVLSDRD